MNLFKTLLVVLILCVSTTAGQATRLNPNPTEVPVYEQAEEKKNRLTQKQKRVIMLVAGVTIGLTLLTVLGFVLGGTFFILGLLATLSGGNFWMLPMAVSTLSFLASIVLGIINANKLIKVKPDPDADKKTSKKRGRKIATSIIFALSSIGGLILSIFGWATSV